MSTNVKDVEDEREQTQFHGNLFRNMCITKWFCCVMVSTLDFESKDPSSSLGRTTRLKTRLVRTEVYFYSQLENTESIYF